MPQAFGPVLISTCFCKTCWERAQVLAELLAENEIRCVFGKDFADKDVTTGVFSRLSSAVFVIAILSRCAEHDISQWVAHEAVCCIHEGKHLILLVERGLSPEGLLKQPERIEFPTGDFDQKTILRLVRKVKAILNVHGLTLGLKQSDEAVAGRAGVFLHVSKGQIGNDCNDTAKSLIEEVKRLTAEGSIEEALEVALRTADADPRCWRALTSAAALHAKLGQRREAEKAVAQVLRAFRRNDKARAAALHQKAWLLETMSGRNPSPVSLRRQRRWYEKSLSLDGESVERLPTRASLAIVLVQSGERDAAVELLEESFAFEGFDDAFKYELETRGLVIEVLSQLPKWVTAFLYPVRPAGPCDQPRRDSEGSERMWA